MPGTRYDENLDRWIVRIFLDSKGLELRHNQLQRELNLRLEDKPSTATLSSHLDKLYRRQILNVRVNEKKHTYYSLTKTFKDVLEIESRNSLANYLENAFSRFDSFHEDRPSRKKVPWQLNIGRRRKSK